MRKIVASRQLRLTPDQKAYIDGELATVTGDSRAQVDCRLKLDHSQTAFAAGLLLNVHGRLIEVHALAATLQSAVAKAVRRARWQYSNQFEDAETSPFHCWDHHSMAAQAAV